MGACTLSRHTVLLLTALLSACSYKFSAKNVFPDGPARTIALMAEKNDLPEQLPSNLKSGINRVGRYDLTPLLWSVKNDNITPHTIGILIRNGADEFYYSKIQLTSPILHSLKYGPFDEFSVIVKNSRNINRYQENDQGYEPTILFSAAVYGDVQKVELLVRSGAKLEIRNDFGQTPLLHSLPGNLSTIMALLKAGADPKARDKNGNDICELLSHVTHSARQAELAAVRKQLRTERVNCESANALRRSNLRNGSKRPSG
jgi:ankyrin repeat protein